MRKLLTLFMLCVGCMLGAAEWVSSYRTAQQRFERQSQRRVPVVLLHVDTIGGMAIL